jgi:hypothetical protein
MMNYAAHRAGDRRDLCHPWRQAAWYIDLLNLNLNNHGLPTARARIQANIETFEPDRRRITEEPRLLVG